MRLPLSATSVSSSPNSLRPIRTGANMPESAPEAPALTLAAFHGFQKVAPELGERGALTGSVASAAMTIAATGVGMLRRRSLIGVGGVRSCASACTSGLSLSVSCGTPQ